MSDASVNTCTHLEPRVSQQQADRDEAFVVTQARIRHDEPGAPAHPEFSVQPLIWLLERTASHYPDRTALIFEGMMLSEKPNMEAAQPFFKQAIAVVSVLTEPW